MTRKNLAIFGAIAITILGVAATAIPYQDLVGPDIAAFLPTLDVAVAAGVATFLLWYALAS